MNQEKPLILVVDDTHELCDLVREVLEEQGYRVIIAYDGLIGWRLTQEELPDLVIIDIEMPKMDGFQLCKKLRDHQRTESTPLIFLTKRGALSDKYRAFTLGGDDFLAKPFEPLELVLRVEARLRQAGRPLRPNRRGLCIDSNERLCWVPGRPAPVTLTDNECTVLAYLLAHPYQVVSARALMAQALEHPVDARTETTLVRNLIQRLREKVEPDHQKPRFIRTLPHAGYMVSPQGGEAAE